MTPESVWEAPALSADDQRLIEAYKATGKTVDELPYTTDFDRLMETLEKRDADLPQKRAVFQRLLYLRKSGRLPRFYI